MTTRWIGTALVAATVAVAGDAGAEELVFESRVVTATPTPQGEQRLHYKGSGPLPLVGSQWRCAVTQKPASDGGAAKIVDCAWGNAAVTIVALCTPSHTDDSAMMVLSDGRINYTISVTCSLTGGRPAALAKPTLI